jgi:hypothetical protein
MRLRVSSRHPTHVLMKHLLLALLLISFSASALADSPEAILKDYRKQAAQALERMNLSLKNATTPLITKLVSSGDTAGAELLTAQLKDKLVGDPVEVPHASAAQLFSLYDEARAKALAPVQKASIARIDNLLKTAGGARLETVTELGKVRELIDGGIVSSTLSTMPMVWDYFTGADRRTSQAVLTFKPNGTLALVSNDKARTNLGRWSFTRDPKVLKVTLFDATEERCEFRINGNDAEFIRPVGIRYMRVKP